MSTRAELALFAHVACRPEAELDLAQAALLIGESERPGLDVAHYLERLAAFGAEARERLSGRAVDDLHAILELLYGEHGFAGNDADFHDPRNSYLDQVLDRKLGIPITLAVVLVETCRHAGVEARGVSFPGHFLVRLPSPRGPLFVDPFAGRLLARADLRALTARHVGGAARDPDPRLLEPASKLQTLVRILNNLRGIWAARGDRERLRDVLERMELLAPSEDTRRQLAALGVAAPSVPPLARN
jgi:regulator of sirC expression with transglutaminase-like and TPR domain